MPVEVPAPRVAAFSVADGITLLRLPLAVAFPLVDDPFWRLLILGCALVTDMSDGLIARRFGASRIGVVLDPVVDKLFMASAFGVVLLSGKLAWWEILAVLARDIVASLAFFITLFTGRPTAVPSRLGGKVVTLLQLATLALFVLDAPSLKRCAWATGAVALYALFDYARPFFRKLQTT